MQSSEATVPAFISEEMFAEVRTKMLRNKVTYASYQAIENYILSGLIYCGECGNTMLGTKESSVKGKNELLAKSLLGIERQIIHIVNAITNGTFNAALLGTLKELEGRSYSAAKNYFKLKQ